MTWIWGAICILFSAFSVLFAAMAVQFAIAKNWKFAAAGAFCFIAFSSAALNAYDGAQGKDISLDLVR